MKNYNCKNTARITPPEFSNCKIENNTCKTKKKL